jgi:hypothetical protein
MQQHTTWPCLQPLLRLQLPQAPTTGHLRAQQQLLRLPTRQRAGASARALLQLLPSLQQPSLALKIRTAWGLQRMTTMLLMQTLVTPQVSPPSTAGQFTDATTSASAP